MSVEVQEFGPREEFRLDVVWCLCCRLFEWAGLRKLD
jgi:hypothetical protein